LARPALEVGDSESRFLHAVIYATGYSNRYSSHPFCSICQNVNYCFLWCRLRALWARSWRSRPPFIRYNRLNPWDSYATARHNNFWFIFKPRLHDTTGCQTGRTTGLSQPVEQPAVSCIQTSNRLRNQLNNRLNVCLHDAAGCSVCCSTGLTTGYIE